MIFPGGAGSASLEKMRAHFASRHTQARADRAYLLGLLGAAERLWQWAQARRSDAETLFELAIEREENAPDWIRKPWDVDSWTRVHQRNEVHVPPIVPILSWRSRSRRWLIWRPWRAKRRRPAWQASTWRALARLASASARESEWADRTAKLAQEVAGGLAHPLEDRDWSPLPPP